MKAATHGLQKRFNRRNFRRRAAEHDAQPRLLRRDWRRQDFDRADEGRDYLSVIDGDGEEIVGVDAYPEDGSAVFLAATNSTRSRQFLVAGLETGLKSRMLGMTSIALWFVVAAAGRWIGFS